MNGPSAPPAAARAVIARTVIAQAVIARTVIARAVIARTVIARTVIARAVIARTVFLRLSAAAWACLAGLLAGTAPVSAQSASTVTVGGVPAVLLKPAGPPRGSIVLMTGGDGQVGVGPGGSVALPGNQLVRTREAYARRGFAVLLPEGDVDVPSAVATMARIARPVALVGTSRGTQRAARGVAQGARPDVLVLTSGFLSPQSGEDVRIHVMGRIGSPARLPPTLVIHHRRDACRLTRPEGVAPFLAWAQGKAQVVWLDGGTSTGDPCGPRSYHGFNGIDDQVVSAITEFVGGR